MPLIKSKSKQAVGENIEKEMDAGKGHKQSIAIALSVQRRAKKPKKLAYGGKAEEDGNPGTPAAKSDDQRPEGFMGSQFTDGSAAPARKPDDMRPSESEYDGELATSDMSHEDKAMHYAKLSKHYQELAYGGMAEADGNPGTPKAKPDDRRPPKENYMSEDWTEGSDPVSIHKPDDMRPPKEDYMGDKMSDGGEAEMHPMSITEAVMKRRKAKMMSEGGVVDLEKNSEESPNYYDELNEETANEPQYDDDQLSAQPKDSNEHGDDIEEDKHDMIESIRKKIKNRVSMR